MGVVGPFNAGVVQLSPSLRIERLDPVDAPAMGALFAAIDPWKRYPISADELTGFFGAEEPGSPRFAIRVEGGLAGAVAITTNWFRGPYIQTFALDPAVQGRGVGSAILAWIEGKAVAACDRNLWVAASDFNEGAHRFYARHGFVRVAAIDGLVRDDRTEILLRKRLAASQQST